RYCNADVYWQADNPRKHERVDVVPSVIAGTEDNVVVERVLEIGRVGHYPGFNGAHARPALSFDIDPFVNVNKPRLAVAPHTSGAGPQVGRGRPPAKPQDTICFQGLPATV